MFKKLDILDEKDKHLRAKSVEVEFPLSRDDKKLIQRIIDHLTYSQIEEYEKKYDLRPGMGVAFPQLGISKRIIVIVHEVEENTFDNYVVVNPVIVSNSEEMIAAEAGEGCHQPAGCGPGENLPVPCGAVRSEDGCRWQSAE